MSTDFKRRVKRVHSPCGLRGSPRANAEQAVWYTRDHTKYRDHTNHTTRDHTTVITLITLLAITLLVITLITLLVGSH